MENLLKDLYWNISDSLAAAYHTYLLANIKRQLNMQEGKFKED